MNRYLRGPHSDSRDLIVELCHDTTSSRQGNSVSVPMTRDAVRIASLTRVREWPPTKRRVRECACLARDQAVHVAKHVKVSDLAMLKGEDRHADPPCVSATRRRRTSRSEVAHLREPRASSPRVHLRECDPFATVRQVAHLLGGTVIALAGRRGCHVGCLLALRPSRIMRTNASRCSGCTREIHAF
jgi:hypothetical protein